jgi:RES domain-containing protein
LTSTLTRYAYRISYIGNSGKLTHDALWLGSLLASGRWHTNHPGEGHPVVYAAETRALAQLEKRVHANNIQPVDQALVRLTIRTNASVMNAKSDLKLKSNWRDDETYTQAFGLSWLKSKKSLMLYVPSYVEPNENNVLLNPHHPQFKSHIKITVEQNPFLFDPRLLN